MNKRLFLLSTLYIFIFKINVSAKEINEKDTFEKTSFAICYNVLGGLFDKNFSTSNSQDFTAIYSFSKKKNN